VSPGAHPSLRYDRDHSEPEYAVSFGLAMQIFTGTATVARQSVVLHSSSHVTRDMQLLVFSENIL